MFPIATAAGLAGQQSTAEVNVPVSILALALFLGALWLAYSLRNRGIAGAATILVVFIGVFWVFLEFMAPVIFDWGPKEAEQVVRNSRATHLLGNLVRPLSADLSDGYHPEEDKFYPREESGTEEPAVVIPTLPVPESVQAPVQIWRHPQICGLEMIGPQLDIFWLDGSGISRVVRAEEATDLCSCGWSLTAGQADLLVACGSGKTEVFSPSSVTGVESLPRPAAPTPTPVPPPTPVPTPRPPTQTELDQICAQDWEEFRRSLSWYDMEQPDNNFPRGYSCQVRIITGLGFLTRNTYEVTCEGLPIGIVEVPDELGQALVEHANEEGWFPGTGLMCSN